MLKNYVKLIVTILFVSNVMAQNIPSYVPKDGLVGWWPFNGNANDESGNGNHGTVNGSTLAADRNGKVNSAYSFDGINDRIKIPYNKQFTDLKGTISLWMNSVKLPENNDAQDVLFGKGWGYPQLVFRNDSKTYIQIANSISSFPSIGTLSNLETNKWNHIVATYEGASLKIYINGKLDNSQVLSSKPEYFSYCESEYWIGGFRHLNSCMPNDSVQFFNGKIDDVFLWNYPLSDQEVKQLYNGCSKETATLNTTNGVVLKNSNPITLSATPTGGLFTGKAILNGNFTPKNANLGSNSVDYHFINNQGCKDSTQFKVVVYDTLGTVCSSTDTLKIKVKLTTGIKAGQLTSMIVYPNPASELLIIEANDIQALSGYKYKIVDFQGKEVYNALATAAKTEISLNSMGAKGMYILHIVDEKGVSIENKKIVLE